MNVINLKNEETIAILEFNQPASKVNVLNSQIMLELDKALDEVASKADKEIKALLFISRKQGIFIAGADIKEIEGITTIDDAIKKAEDGKAVLQKISALKIPTMAVINGACLGGGLELALFCKYRVAGFDPKIKIGLPEVKLGILPGFGGTQNLPRVVGLTQALSMILAGQVINAEKAKKIGLVDKLFADERLVEDAKEYMQQIISMRKKRNCSERNRRIIPFFSIANFLENTFIGNAIVFSQAKKNVLKKTKGFYPAPLAVIKLIKKTYGKDLKKGFKLESEAFAKLVITDVSKNLVKIFYLYEDYKKRVWVDKEVKPEKIGKTAVIGAGIMGGGIAQIIAYKDMYVRIKDIAYPQLAQALKVARKLFDKLVKKRKINSAEAEYMISKISPTINHDGFKNADIVIEAVVENIKVKKKVFAELGRVCSQEAVLASNTSALSILEMGEAANAPERTVGIHFFNPVHKMPLVEIVRSEKTNDQTIANALKFVRSLGKLAIVVKDVRGFLINRILLIYMIEALSLLDEGLKIEQTDSIAKKFGMPMGPFELCDEVGVDVGLKVVQILNDSYGDRMKPSDILQQVYDKKWFGKKAQANKGFYRYKNGRKIGVNRAVYDLLSSISPILPLKKRRESGLDSKTAIDRMTYVMVNEAARCLEEGVATEPSTIDIGMVMGTGFPPFKGGLLRWADSIGAEKIVKRLNELANKFNKSRFEVCDYLKKLSNEKGNFYK